MDERILRTCAEHGWNVENDRITIGLEEGRHQVVRVEQYENRSGSYLRLYSPLGDAAAVDERRLRASLRLNWNLAHGAVAIAALGDDGERLVLCTSIPLADVDSTRVSLAIEELARTADGYEHFVFGTDDY